MKSFYKYLVYYYGFLQVVHLLMNFVVIFVPSFESASLLSTNLDKGEFQVLLSSSYIDFLLASPLGIVFVCGFMKNKKWADTVGIISLTAALVSAFIYTYFLVIFNAWEFSLPNILINIVFVPIFILYFLLLKNNSK